MGDGCGPDEPSIVVTVVDAGEGFVEMQVMRLAAGATVAVALVRAGLDERLALMRSATRTSQAGVHGVSLFGERTSADQRLVDGDRIEVTRPVSLDVRLRRQARVDGERRARRDQQRRVPRSRQQRNARTTQDRVDDTDRGA